MKPRDLTMHGLARQFLRTFIKVDGRVINSCRSLIARPGVLTLAFQNGQRKPYLKPIQLFVIANLLFFAIQSSSKLRVFSTLLEAQISDEPWSEIARALVERHLAKIGSTLGAYAPIYDQAVALNAKSLIGLMILPFALCLSLAFWRSKRPFAVHVVFTLHFFAFMLLLFCLPAIAAAIEGLFGGTVMLSERADDIESILLLGACAAYLYLAINRVYGSDGYKQIIQALVMTVALVGVFFAYRFVLLPITLYTA